jgi:chromosome partitioning protein
MTRVLAIANQKGGVAKTTTTHTLGVALARRGRRVLLVDLDAQACLSFSCGLDPDALTLSVADILLDRHKLCDVATGVNEVHLVPATIDLARAEVELRSQRDCDFALRDALRVSLDDYDDVLLDCAPSLGILTVNALTAADEVVIPVQCEALAHRGIAQLLDTVDEVRKFTNPAVRVRGVVATMFDARVRHGRQVLDDIPRRFGLPVLEPPIPKSVRFAEAPLHGCTILDHAPDSPGARAYEQLAERLITTAP